MTWGGMKREKNKFVFSVVALKLHPPPPPALNQVSPNTCKHFCQTSLAECGCYCSCSSEGSGLFISFLAH